MNNLWLHSGSRDCSKRSLLWGLIPRADTLHYMVKTLFQSLNLRRRITFLCLFWVTLSFQNDFKRFLIYKLIVMKTKKRIGASWRALLKLREKSKVESRSLILQNQMIIKTKRSLISRLSTLIELLLEFPMILKKCSVAPKRKTIF